MTVCFIARWSFKSL